MLKISGILMLIGGILTFIVSVGALIAGGLLGGAVANELAGEAGAVAGTAIVGVALIIAGYMLVIAIFNSVVGIMGIKNANNPEGAKKCFIMGIISITSCVRETNSVSSYNCSNISA